MIKKRLFMPLIAALALVSCSDRDYADDPSDNGKNFGYVAVNIVQPKEAATRVDANDFEDGSPAENSATEGLFFIFNADGTKMFGNAQRLTLGTASIPNAPLNPAVEKLYSAVLVINGEKGDKPTDANQIVCVLNAPDGLEFGVKTLKELQDKVDEYDAHTDGTFIMSNSVYMAGDKKVIGQEITEADIKSTDKEAIENPLTIYVERVVAKIRAKSKEAKGEGETGAANNGAEPYIDGTKTKLTIDVTGIEIANIAQSAYLLKNIDNLDAATYNWAWDPSNRRSYWESCVFPANKTLTYGNKSYNKIVEDNSVADFGNINFPEQYVLPNTSATKTCVLVTAKLKYADGENKGQPVDLAYILGGYFPKAKALKFAANYVQENGYMIQTQPASGDDPAKYKGIDEDYYIWANNNDLAEADKISYLKDYEVVARINPEMAATLEANLYRVVNGKATKATVKEINNLLKGGAGDDEHPYVARVFTEGKCYYFVEIDQSSVAGADPNTWQGVVRNHVYDLTLNSIGGIGTPIFDPNDVIIPQRPDVTQLWYLSAEIKVLKWRLVKQTVDFTGN